VGEDDRPVPGLQRITGVLRCARDDAEVVQL